MTSLDWLRILVLVACIWCMWSAQRSATKAVEALAATKKLVANLWDRKEDGR